MNCPICKSRDSAKRKFVVLREDKFAITKARKKRRATYRECRNCGVMALDDSQEYEMVYSDGTYYKMEGESSLFFDNRFRQVIRLPSAKSDNYQRIKRIKKFIKNDLPLNNHSLNNVLDIGAGLGVFLYKFVNKKWKGTAIEPDSNACEHLKKTMPEIEVINGFLHHLPTDKKFDLITLNRVLEHIYDPLKLLKSVKNHLKKKGVLYIELPDVNSYFFDGVNNEAFGYGHYHVYSPASLSHLISQAGLKLILFNRVVEPSTKFTLYAFCIKKENKIH